jgi:hypothetical protein
MRDRDRGERDHDHIVDDDRPAGDEADQLVAERGPCEGRRPSAFGEHRLALHVGQRVEEEDDPNAEEDQGREAKTEVGHQTKREEEREADRRVRDGEKQRHSEIAAACREPGTFAQSPALSER